MKSQCSFPLTRVRMLAHPHQRRDSVGQVNYISARTDKLTSFNHASIIIIGEKLHAIQTNNSNALLLSLCPQKLLLIVFMFSSTSDDTLRAGLNIREDGPVSMAPKGS